MGIEHRCDIDIVFVTRLQGKYFTRKNRNWLNWRQTSESDIIYVAKLTIQEDEIDLVPVSARMPWESWAQCTQLIVLVDVEMFMNAILSNKRKLINSNKRYLKAIKL